MAKFNINRFNSSNNPVQPGNNNYDVSQENTELFGDLMSQFLNETKAPDSNHKTMLTFTQTFLETHNVPHETSQTIISTIKTLNTETLSTHDISFMQAAVDLVNEINTLPGDIVDSFKFELHEQLEIKNKQKGQTLL